MKSPIRLTLVLLLLLAVPTVVEAKLHVVTSLQDLAALATEVGGDRVEVLALARGYQDPHFVDAKPSFVLQLSRADLLVVAGLELEIGYLPALVDQSRNAKLQPGGSGFLDASVGCEILGRPTAAVSRAMGDVHPYGNPHYWTDPENGRIMARAIAAKLSALDPGGAETYRRNLATFETKLDMKEKAWRERLAPFSGTDVVTFHDSWPNFARRFGLTIVGHVEPKPGIPPSPTHTLEIVNLIRAKKVPLILVEPYFDTKTPKAIAEQTGATVLTLYPSVGGRPEIGDYLALFDYNVEALAQALGGGK
ncbi:MAG: zinc ABC transporter substrate-binding protein [Holophagales bacterium]|nr:MAG: zinc ABC transporter substrate-binding protein [Holophagales bacterium]